MTWLCHVTSESHVVSSCLIVRQSRGQRAMPPWGVSGCCTERKVLWSHTLGKWWIAEGLPLAFKTPVSAVGP